jgi:hypothetical protein
MSGGIPNIYSPESLWLGKKRIVTIRDCGQRTINSGLDCGRIISSGDTGQRVYLVIGMIQDAGVQR